MENKEKLKKLIEDSGLELEDKTLWYRYLEIGKKPEIDTLLETLEQNPEELEFLTKNFKDKFEAFQSGNKEAWNKIAEEDLKYIDKEE